MKKLLPIVSAIISICAAILSICAICAIASPPPPQQPAQCCTPRLQAVKADGTTWLCLIEEDTNGVERHRSCQMADMSEHAE